MGTRRAGRYLVHGRILATVLSKNAVQGLSDPIFTSLFNPVTELGLYLAARWILLCRHTYPTTRLIPGKLRLRGEDEEHSREV